MLDVMYQHRPSIHEIWGTKITEREERYCTSCSVATEDWEYCTECGDVVCEHCVDDEGKCTYCQ